MKAADKFLSSCEAADRIPDVFLFLEAEPHASDGELIDVLLVDQHQRWKRNQALPVEHYLQRTPHIDDLHKVELLLEEFGYLEQRGIAPSPEEFADRFRHLSAHATTALRAGLELGPSVENDKPHLAQQDSATSARIGRYEVVRELGHGAFGKVYLAKDPNLEREVAVKVPNEKTVHEGGGIDEILAEARAVAKLDHPNIVPVFDYGITEDGCCFIVSKYVRGKELRNEIRKGIEQDRAAFLTSKLAGALHAAHKQGIVHRDVKPGNIIIDRQGEPHLLDFGLARTNTPKQEHAIVGTPAYMSPEQAEGQNRRIDGRSDIYSLGVVFYEMLTGHRPFSSPDAAEILAQIKEGEVPPPRQSNDSIAPELENICMQSLSRELNHRFRTAKDMADELETYLATVETVTMSDGSTKRLPTQHRTKQKPLVPIGYLVATVVVVFGIWLSPTIFHRLFPKETGLHSVPNNENRESTSSTKPNSRTQKRTDTDPGIVAVMGFQNGFGKPEWNWLGMGLTDLLRNEISKSEGNTIVAHWKVGRLKSDLQLSDSTQYPSSTTRRVRDILKTDWIVSGNISPAKADLEQFRWEVVLHNSQTERVFKFSLLQQTSAWWEVAPKMAAQLREKLGWSTPELNANNILGKPRIAESAMPSFFEGLSALTQHEHARAIAAFSRAAQTDPKSALIHESLGTIYADRGNFRKAVEHIDRAVSLTGDSVAPACLRRMAKKQHWSGQPELAAATYRELLQLENSDVPRYQPKLIQAMIDAGMANSALAEIERYLKTDQDKLQLAELHLLSARAAEAVSNYQDEIDCAEKARVLAEQIGSHWVLGRAKLQQGQGFRRLGQHEEALNCFVAACEILPEVDSIERARAIAGWAKSLIDNGDFELAKTKIQEGHELATNLQHEELVARHIGLLGELNVFRGKYNEAESKLSDALLRFTKIGNQRGVADMNLTLANVVARQGNADRALEIIGKAKAAYQSIGERRGEARTWGQQGGILARRGKVMEARAHFERALDLFVEIEDQRGEATCLSDIASTHSKHGHFQKATEYFSQSLEIHRRLGSNRGPDIVMYNLGVLYFRTGKLSESKRLIAESVNLFQRNGNLMNACFVQRKLGEIQMESGDLVAAKKTLSTTLDLANEIGSASLIAATIASQAKLAEYLDTIQSARELQKKSLEVREKANLRVNAASNHLDLVHLDLLDGNIREAQSRLKEFAPQLLVQIPDWKPLILATESRVLALTGNKKDAEEKLTDAISSLPEVEEIDWSVRFVFELHLAAGELAVGKASEAESRLQRLEEKAKKMKFMATYWQAMVLRREASLALRRELPESLANLRKELEKVGFSGLNSRITK